MMKQELIVFISTLFKMEAVFFSNGEYANENKEEVIEEEVTTNK